MKRLQPHKIDDAKYYERIWTEEIKAGRKYFDRVRQEFLASKVKENDWVIDLGAGVFGTVQFIAERMAIPGVRLFAYDQSYTAKEIVDEYNLPVMYFLGDLDPVQFPSSSFDCVVAGEIIEHMEDPQRFVDEMARLCKPGGWLTMTTVDTNCEQAIAHGVYPEHIWEFTPEDLVTMFSIHGETEYVLVGNYHGIVCRVGLG